MALTLALQSAVSTESRGRILKPAVRSLLSMVSSVKIDRISFEIDKMNPKSWTVFRPNLPGLYPQSANQDKPTRDISVLARDANNHCSVY